MRSGAWLPCIFCIVGFILRGNVAFAYENIAINQTAWHQYSYGGRPWGADKAVDGLFTDRSADGRQCTISDNNQRIATWRVDLGVVLSIHHIRIYYRTDNRAWDASNFLVPRFLGFSVYISNTTKKDDGILCFKDTNYTRATIPDNVTIECVNHGRYVVYYNERLQEVTYPVGYSTYAYNELCELEVYGCPNSMFYGENCNLPCPTNCKEGRCNIESGSCMGCTKGFKGPRCEEQCDNKRYGPECNMTCGNCSDDEQCNNVNGSCPKGCDVGVHGFTCNEACPCGRYGKNCDEFCKPNCRGCNRFTGVCEFGCRAGWKYFIFGFITKYSDVEASRQCDPSLYGIITILCLSMALNIFFVIWFYKRQHQVMKNTNQLSTVYAVPNTKLYDKPGQMSLSTDHRTSKTQIYDNVEDNVGYQELGQLSQPSLYDKLHQS